jgi:hypothetical protein
MTDRRPDETAVMPPDESELAVCTPAGERAVRLMIQKMRARERKRFGQILRAECGVTTKEEMACNTLRVQWAVTVEEVQQLLQHWHHRSALIRCGIARLLAERYGDRARQRRAARKRKSRKLQPNDDGDAQLQLVVWNFSRLVREHARRHLAMCTKDGHWFRPPLVITAADLVPLASDEMTVLHRRSCRQLAAFCDTLIAPEQALCQAGLKCAVTAAADGSC